MKERYDAYEVAVRNNILQIDEIRREEDYEPLGFNFVKLGLSDVLLNPETMEVFTPNTGQQKNLLTGEERAEDMELRFNPNHDDRGRFTSGSGGGSRSKKTGLTNKSASAKIGKKELKDITSQINTYYSKRYEGKTAGIYYSGEYSKAYEFDIFGYGDYYFNKVKKIK